MDMNDPTRLATHDYLVRLRVGASTMKSASVAVELCRRSTMLCELWSLLRPGVRLPHPASVSECVRRGACGPLCCQRR